MSKIVAKNHLKEGRMEIRKKITTGLFLNVFRGRTDILPLEFVNKT